MTDQLDTSSIRDMLQNRRAQGWSSGRDDATILALCDALDAAIAEVRMLQACVTHAMGDVHDLLGVATDDEVDAILAAWGRLDFDMPDTVVSKLRAENERLLTSIAVAREKARRAGRHNDQAAQQARYRRAEIKGHQRRIVHLQAENDRLRAALSPCVKMLDDLVSESGRGVDWGHEDAFRMGEWFEAHDMDAIETARAALAQKEAE